MVEHPGAPERDHRWLPWSGAGAVLGALLWTAMPWAGRAVLGTRPYVGTAFDVGSLAGWLLMLGGLVGAHLTFRPVPATGEDPAGLVLSLAALLGHGLVLAGAGGLGLALWRVGGRPTPTAGLLLLAALVPFVAVPLRFGSLLPLPVRRLLVGTNAAFVPLGVAWMALGYRVWTAARPALRSR